MLQALPMARIAVVGAGMMGSALCVPLADAGHDVRLIGSPLDEASILDLQRSKAHPLLGVSLPSSVRCQLAQDLGPASEEADAIVLGVSSAGVGWAARALAPVLEQRARPVLMLSKGLVFEHGLLSVLSEAFRAALPPPLRPICQPVAVCGPCIAGELARRVPTLVVFSGHESTLAHAFAAWVRTPYYRAVVHRDVVGAQVCAALKNAYALGIAFGAGLHARAGGQPGSVAMHNYEAAVFAQACLEMQQLVSRLGGDAASVLGLAGTGDLTVTCNGGRTGRFGALLGRGQTPSEATHAMQGATLECLEVLAVLDRYLAHAGAARRAELPLLSRLIEIALEGAPVELPFQDFFRG